MILTYFLLVITLSVFMFITVRLHKLTPIAALTGGIIGFILFAGASYAGITIMSAFFIMATVATSWRINDKVRSGLAEINKGRRTMGQVLANGGVAGLLGLTACMYPQHQHLFTLMIAASFASATADTLSSELGNVYGSRFYNILTLKKDSKGLNGVVSTEGTLTGLAGSIVIAMVYAIAYGVNKDVIIIIVAGTIGNITDSVLGATLERSKYITNNAVNFLNTLVASIAALLMYKIV